MAAQKQGNTTHREEIAAMERQGAIGCLDSLLVVEQVFSDTIL